MNETVRKNELFWSFFASSLPNDVTMAVFSVGARTEDGWDFLFEKYKESMYVSMKSRIKMALTTSPLDHKLKW